MLFNYALNTVRERSQTVSFTVYDS